MTSSNDQSPTQDKLSLHGDRAIGAGDLDRLGFGQLASHMASALVDQAAAAGLVVGLEGKWGSGKSSLLYLITEALRKLPSDQRPEIVEFRPWLVGSRDALLTSLFTDLSKAIDRIELAAGDASRTTARKAGKTGKIIRDFAARLEGLGKLTSATGILIPGVGVVGGFIEKVSDAAKSKSEQKPLADTKDELSAALASLGRRIIVTIDDVDRLEPAEIAEILRLVRSVADFPNVVYLLCYDESILAHGVQAATKVENGRAFLEKIVQVSVGVPLPEPFDLRRWFSDDLSKFAATDNDDQRRRLASIIDLEGGRRLTTPRAVVRTLNALRFVYPALRGTVDLPDLVWLQLIRASNPVFYRWIERYCATAAANSSGRAQTSDHGKTGLLNELIDIIAKDGEPFREYSWELSDYLPGFSNFYGDDPASAKLLAKASDSEIQQAVRDRRLSSPDHYRLYFALSEPTNTPRADDFTNFLTAVDNSAAETSTLLLNWTDLVTDTGASKAELMLDRLRGEASEQLTPDRAENLLLALANSLDEAAKKRGLNEWLGPTIWRLGERLLPVLREKLSAERRADVTLQAFRSGEALGWLTSIFRSETFAHGRFGDRPKLDESRLLTSAELDAVTEIMLTRYRELSFADLLATPQPVSLLFAWQQGGDQDGPANLIKPHIATDEGLVSVLEKLIGRVTSTEGQFTTLSRDNVSAWLDYSQARARVAAIAADKNGSDLSRRAGVLLKAFEDGERF